MTSNELHVVIGASGGTGSAIVQELIARGKRVRGVNRSSHANFPFDVELFKANAADSIQMREVCQGATVVYNCVNPPFTQVHWLSPCWGKTCLEPHSLASDVVWQSGFAIDTAVYW